MDGGFLLDDSLAACGSLSRGIRAGLLVWRILILIPSIIALLALALNGDAPLKPRATLGPGFGGPVAFSPNGKAVAIGGGLWDLAGKRRRFAYPLAASGAAFSPDGATLAVRMEFGRLLLIDTANARERASAFAHKEGPYGNHSVAFAPDGRTLAVLSPDMVERFDPTTLKLRGVRNSRGYFFACLAYAPDGRGVALGCDDGLVRLWDGDLAHPLGTLGTPGNDKVASRSILSLAYPADGKALAAGMKNGFVRLWEPAATPPRALWEVQANLRHDDPKDIDVRSVLGLAFRPGGKQIAVAGRGGGDVTLLDAATGGRLATFRADFGDPEMEFAKIGTPGQVDALAFSPDGQTLATAGSDGVVKFWDVEEILRLKPKD